MRTILFLIIFFNTFLLYSQDERQFNYRFYKDSINNLFLQEIIISKNGVKTINEIPIEDSAALANALKNSFDLKFKEYNRRMIQYMRLDKNNFAPDTRNVLLYQQLTNQSINYDMVSVIPDSLMGVYELLDTSKQIQSFRFKMFKGNGTVFITNLDNTVVHSSFLHTYTEIPNDIPSAMMEITFKDVDIPPTIFYLFAHVTINNRKVPIWTNDNFKYQFYKIE